LAAEDLDKLVELCVGRLIVGEHPDPPVPLGHHLRRINDDRSLAPSEIGVVDCSLTNVEDKSRTAKVVCSSMIEGQVARAHEFARAGLGVAAL
jgi:hypothetical protein